MVGLQQTFTETFNNDSLESWGDNKIEYAFLAREHTPGSFPELENRLLCFVVGHRFDAQLLMCQVGEDTQVPNTTTLIFDTL